jgi:hypothetical protein
MGSVNNQINKLGTDSDIIPGGYTGSVQVLDKGVNKPFKGYLRDKFEEWMCTNGSRRRPSNSEVVQWVAKAWEQVTTAAIVNTWKSFGHKVADDDDDDDDDEENIIANQPGAGQETLEMTRMMKLNNSFFINWHMRGKLQLLSSNTTLTMTKMTNPSSWT